MLILDACDLEPDKKRNYTNRLNDAAYTLARALQAARLNQDAGACPVSLDQWAEYESEYVEYGDFGPYVTFEAVLTRADVILSDELVMF